MKISEVYPEYVFQRLQKYIVVAVDFNVGQYIDLRLKTVDAVRKLIEKENVKFYQIEYDENA